MQPVQNQERLSTIDTIRGFALLGILLMNIPTFAFPEEAYLNPTVWTSNDWLDRTIVTLVYLLGEGKMRGIFSLMFGASALLLISRGEKRAGGIGIADIYYRRTLWLLLFGVIHSYMIWHGDILFPYALIGLMLFPFRVLSARALVVVAGIQLTILTGFSVGEAWDARDRWQEFQKVQGLQETTFLSKEQREALDEGLEMERKARPSREKLEEEVKAYRGSYVDNFKARAKSTWKWHRYPIYVPMLWDMMAMMLIGMALYKIGVLTGEKPDGFCWRMAGWGALTGFTVNGVTMWLKFQHDFHWTRGFFDDIGYEAGRVPMSLCYVALLVLAVRHGWARWLTGRLASVGQMAFSNYISHSLICSVIFYGGFGFGLIGRLDRWQVYSIVFAIWTFNLTWSPWWLKRYHFGPLEWGWRSLTYGKRQPWRILPTEPPAPPSERIAEPSEVVTATSPLLDPAMTAEGPATPAKP